MSTHIRIYWPGSRFELILSTRNIERIRRSRPDLYKFREENFRAMERDSNVAESITHIRRGFSVAQNRRNRLRELNCFVLDNSIRESTVGQIRGHTLENKLKIYEEVKKCGFKEIIVAWLDHTNRVDDHFVKLLIELGEDVCAMYCLVEYRECVFEGVPDEVIPTGLIKMKELGLPNPILEIDLADSEVDYAKFGVEKIWKLLLCRIEWINENLSKESKVMVNFRDFHVVMKIAPDRLLAIVSYLARLPSCMKPKAILVEEASGQFLPEEVAAWTAGVRKIMEKNGWASGNLLIHVHERWGMAQQVQLECLMEGANGIWASVCEEGVAVGHPSSSVTLMNLIQMGNEKVLQAYNCHYLRKAAICVTELTTGKKPSPKQIIYGERALDYSFDINNFVQGIPSKNELDLANFFGEEQPIRISTEASNQMIQRRLVQLFGENPSFTPSIAKKMRELMNQDLINNKKEEYMSKTSLALLFCRAGGTLSDAIKAAVVRTGDGENPPICSKFGCASISRKRLTIPLIRRNLLSSLLSIINSWMPTLKFTGNIIRYEGVKETFWVILSVLSGQL